MSDLFATSQNIARQAEFAQQSIFQNIFYLYQAIKLDEK